MALSILYAGCELTSRSARKSGAPAGSADALKSLATIVDAGFKGPLNPESEVAVLKTAESGALKDPFIDDPSLYSRDAAGTNDGARTPGFSYSGILQVGDATVAFINGHEYRVGDELTEGGYVVEKIDRAEVVLRGTTGGGVVTVPIDEGSFEP
jgi:hypothetical protein